MLEELHMNTFHLSDLPQVGDCSELLCGVCGSSRIEAWGIGTDIPFQASGALAGCCRRHSDHSRDA